MQKQIFLTTSLCILCLSLSYGQDRTALQYANNIDSTKLRTTLSKLASDEFEGRASGEKGGQMTTDYLATYLRAIGVAPGNGRSYFQDIGAIKRNPGKKSFELDNFDYVDYYSYSNEHQQDSIIKVDKILFVGYGQYSNTYNDYGRLDISDQVIMLLDGTPYNRYGIEYAKNDKSKEYLKQKKPKAIIKIREGYHTYSSYTYRQTLFPHRLDAKDFAEIRVTEGLANKLLEPTGKTVKQIAYEVESTGVSPSMEIENPVTFTGDYRYEKLNAYNVIAYIEGKDLKDEYIVLSAHHDHEGISYNDQVYNGADDNASGVSGALEIARVLAKAKKEGKGPRCSVVILLPTAEENGLIGSNYYTQHPVYPLEKTVACVNLDMMGRVSFDYEEKGNNYVYLINHKEMSGTLPSRLEEVNKQTVNLTIDYKHTSPGDGQRYFSRSDQYNFAEKGIPSIMLTSGEHKDYHKVSDDVEWIDFDGLWKRTKLAFLLVWELANTDAKFIKN